MSLNVAHPGFGPKRLLIAAASFAITLGAAPAHASSIPFILGVNTGIHDGPQTVPAAHSVGADSVRIDVPWNDIERVKGRYEVPAWLEQRVATALSLQLTPLMILEYGNSLYGGGKPRTQASRQAFAQYAEFVVKHFKGRVWLFELWNEWEGNTGGAPPGSAREYVSLAQITYPVIKRVNPQAVVLSGGLFDLSDGYAHWFHEFLARGGLHFVDALSIHPYNFRAGLEATPYFAISQVAKMHALATAANGGRALDVYVSEIGYPDYSGPGGLPQEGVASYLERFMLLAAAYPYIRGVWWYCLRNQGFKTDDVESNFGLYTFEFKQKPQALAFARVSMFLRSVSALSVSGTQNQQTFYVTCNDGRRATFTLPADAGIAPDLPTCRQ
jgi:hypothetical protein